MWFRGWVEGGLVICGMCVCVFGAHMFQDPHASHMSVRKSSLRKDMAIIARSKSVSQVVLIIDHG